MATLSKLQKLPEISKNYKNPNFRTDFGTQINQIFKLKFVFTRLSILMVILSNNLRKSGAPLSLSLTNGSLFRNDIIVNSVFSPESAHAQYCFHIWSHLCFTCSILKLKSQITWRQNSFHHYRCYTYYSVIARLITRQNRKGTI